MGQPYSSRVRRHFGPFLILVVPQEILERSLYGPPLSEQVPLGIRPKMYYLPVISIRALINSINRHLLCFAWEGCKNIFFSEEKKPDRQDVLHF